MTFVLSWKFTLLRLIVGLVLTFGISYFANRFVKNPTPVSMDKLIEDAEVDKRPFLNRWLTSLGSMVLYVVPAYVLSVLILGAARFWLFPQLSDSMSNSLIAILLFAVAGMLFVIPTAAEIPIIQTLMAMGAWSSTSCSPAYYTAKYKLAIFIDGSKILSKKSARICIHIGSRFRDYQWINRKINILVC